MVSSMKVNNDGAIENEADREYLEILKHVPPPASGLDIQAWRSMVDSLRPATMEKERGGFTTVKEYDIQIPARDGTIIEARVYSQNREATKGNAMLVAFHGGGFCMGHHTDESATYRRIVSSLNIVVVSVGYRLAPEHPFPTGVNDAWDATKWLFKNASAVQVDTNEGFIVGGVSAGGNLACVIAHINRDEGNPVEITGQFLSVPTILPPPVVPEKYRARYLSFKTNEGLGPPPYEMVILCMDALKPDIHSSLFVPFNNPNGHAGLPPTYFQVCGLDQLRDEALIYESVLREENNISTRVDFYPGLPHHFWEFFPQLTAQSQKREEDTVKGIEWLLNSKP
ncbi:Alpha/Beta hydrolase protein [Cadophora sp. MPI-SDFR-AT-0126]|nr:Alpha/Beta hydrolase protein [Leotiomycetes sp. MPI-SDFR-AT-0126]